MQRHVRGGGPAPAGTGLTPRDAMLFARLLAALPGAYGSWLDEAMARAAPDADLLALWRRALARARAAAEGSLAASLADGPVPLRGADPATPFAWRRVILPQQAMPRAPSGPRAPRPRNPLAARPGVGMCSSGCSGAS